MAEEPRVVVSPDVSKRRIRVGPSDETDTALLIPVSEWKQAAVRATRATIPAAVVLGGGGTAAQAASNTGLSPLLLVGLPSTGVFLSDTALICAVIWVLWFLWNVVEFALDLDTSAPQLRM